MMETMFYLAALVALAATLLALTRSNATHALIYLIVSLLAVAVLFFLMGAPFAAALEIVIYAGAIMVLFVFVIMMLNLGESGDRRERQWLEPRIWIVPAILAAVLLAEMIAVESVAHGRSVRRGARGAERGEYIEGQDLRLIAVVVGRGLAYAGAQLERLVGAERVPFDIAAERVDGAHGFAARGIVAVR